MDDRWWQEARHRMWTIGSSPDGTRALYARRGADGEWEYAITCERDGVSTVEVRFTRGEAIPGKP